MTQRSAWEQPLVEIDVVRELVKDNFRAELSRRVNDDGWSVTGFAVDGGVHYALLMRNRPEYK